MIAELEVGKHAQFLNRPRGEILCLIDDEKRPFAIHGELAQERLQRSQQDGLAHRPDRKAESDSDRSQHVVGVQLRADELRGNDLFPIELLYEAAHDRGLARANLARDNDEPFALVEAVLQIRERALVPPAAEEECRIGIQLKGLAGQLVERLVHCGCQWKMWIRPTRTATSL